MALQFYITRNKLRSSKNKNQLYINLLFNIIISSLLFKAFFSYELKINIKLHSQNDGHITLITQEDQCPKRLIENGNTIGSNECGHYFNRGNHTIDIEWDDPFEKLANMFEDKKFIVEIDLSHFDASNIKYMGLMFKGCTSLKKVIMPSITGDNLEQMQSMFEGCTNLKSVEFQKDFRTTNVKQMECMFNHCFNLEYINFPSNFETTNVITIQDMFKECYSLSSINFDIFKTSNVNNMASLFQGTKLTSYDLSKFDTSKVTDIEYMFYNCTEITSLNFSNFNFSSMKKMDNMLNHNYNLEYVTFGTNEISEEITTWHAFDNINKKTIIYADKKRPENFFLYSNLNFSIVECNNISSNDIMNEFSEIKIVCVPSCKNLYNYTFKYINRCYSECPPNTISNISDYTCEKNTSIPKTIPLATIIPIIPKIIPSTTIKTIPAIKPSTIIPDKVELTSIITEKIETNLITECTIKEYLLGRCKNNYQTEEERKNFTKNVINEIIKGNINEILSSVVKENKVILIQDEKEKYQISTISGQRELTNSTYIDFGDCEKLLKSHYGLNNSEELIIFKIEHTIEGIKIPIIEYALFSNNGSIILDSNICKNKLIKYNTQVSIDSNEIYKYDLTSDYYNDLCTQYYFDNIDLTIYDRKYEYNEKNLSLCEYNCTFQKYDLDTSIVECLCSTKNDLNNFNNTNFDNNLLLNKVELEQKKINFDVTKCINLFTSKEELKTNSSFYIFLIFLILLIIVGIIFCCKGYNDLSDKMDTIIDKKFNEQNNNNKKEKIYKKKRKNKKNPPKKVRLNKIHKEKKETKKYG